MTNPDTNDSRYRDLYESNPSRASRLRDCLANRLKVAADPELTRNTIRELADRLGVPVLLGDADPVRNLSVMGKAFLDAFESAGTDTDMDRRGELVRIAVAWGKALQAVVMRWDQEMSSADDDLVRRWWGRKP